MRLAVLADIHANLPALDAVFSEIINYNVDGILFAGDIVGDPFRVRP